MHERRTPLRSVPDLDPVLTAGEVARIFRVAPQTVSRWAIHGHLTSFRTPGGHRRFRKAQVDALLHANTPTPADHR